MIPSADSDNEAAMASIDPDDAFKPLPGNGLCGRLSDKWTVLVLWRLGNMRGERLRFSALKRELQDVTQRMLTLTLRNLERDGLVDRHYFAEVPPRVEYSITKLGFGVLEALRNVNRWVRHNMPSIEANRLAYDRGVSKTGQRGRTAFPVPRDPERSARPEE